MNIEGGAGVLLHNTVVTAVPDSETTLESCLRVDEVSQPLIGSAIAINNLIQDCAIEGTGTLAVGESGEELTALTNDSIIPLEPSFLSTIAVAELEAILSEPIDWDNINAEYPDSTADTDFLVGTDYMGAVDPLLGEDVIPWWADWTIRCSLANSRFWVCLLYTSPSPRD